MWKNKRYRNCETPEEPVSGQTPIFLNIPSRGDEGIPFPQASIRVVENKILFYGEIDENSMLELNRLLMEIDIKLQNTKNSLGDEFDPVCHLHLNTPGGEIYSALSTVDTIKSLKSKVYTYIDGAVASAGTLISTVGAKRFSGEHGHMLIHQLSSGMYGKFAEMEDDFYNSKNLMKVLKDFYKKNTKIPMKKLDELLKRDIWLTAKECLQYGIIDEIR